MPNRRHFQGLVLFASAFVAVAASAQPIHLLPKYSIRGEEITDTVAIKQERKGFEASYQQFRVAATEYQAAVKEFIGREINGRKSALNEQYKGQIDALDKAQYDLRRDAIARMEEFVFRHRDHDVYTPDTLFRLAELYYEDGGNPSEEILQAFLQLCEGERGAIAVHCKAGLGRTGTNIAAYMMKHYGYTAKETMAWCR